MNDHIAKTIKQIRKDKDITQEELAYMIGKSPGHVGMLEQGRTKPSYETLQNLISAFRLDANIFFEQQPEDEPPANYGAIAALSELREGRQHDPARTLRIIHRILDDYVKQERKDSSV